VKQRVVFSLLLCALVLVVFQQARTFTFLSWDDTINVTENPLVLGAHADGLARAWREPYAGLYVPVAYSWFWALAKACGQGALDPRLFHAGNLLLHLACAWLVFRIVARLVVDERAALVGALVFAVHPLVAESVAWVTEARGLLSAMFSLVALDLWLARAVAERDGKASGAAWRAIVATVCFAAALLAKPQAAALPLTLALLDRYVVGRPWKRVWPLVAAWGAMAAAVFLATKSLQADETLRNVAPLWSRPLVALDAFGFYAWKTIVPVGLAADYGRRPQHLLEDVTRAWPALVFTALVLALVAIRPLRRWIPFAALFVAALLPVSGLVPFGYQDISTVADRYAYPALFAAALLVATLLVRASATTQWTVLVLVFAPLATLATRQIDTWRNDRELFTRVLEVNPNSWKAYSNLGLAEARAGRLDAAVANYRKSLEIGPSRWIVHQNLGLVLCQQQKLVEGERELAQSFALRRENLDVAAQLGSVRLSLGRFADAEEPLRVARALDPERADVAECLGTSLLAQGKDEEAIAELRAALARRESPDARKNLAQALMLRGDVRGAILELETALRAKPGWPDVQSDLAWLLATAEDDTLRDGARAMTLIGDVLSKTKSPSILQVDTLAAAQAAVGRFTDAVNTLDQLLQAVGGMDATIRSRLEARRAAYAEKRAWRGVVR
jgi:tetratricopeptide (TPR) repeat protein